MRKDLYEFDQEFLKLINVGSRAELFSYRNAIIDELNRRGENKNPYATAKEEVSKISKLYQIVTHGEIAFLGIVIVVLTADIVHSIALFARGETNQTFVIALILDAICIIVAISRMRIHRESLEEEPTPDETISALALQAKVEEHQLGRKLMTEPLELLRRKKQQIDEKLGL